MIRILSGGRRNALAAAVAMLAAVLLTGTGHASAAPAADRRPPIAAAHTGVEATTTAAAPEEPAAEFAGTLRFTLAQISPAAVTSAGPTMLTLRGRITNTGDVPVSRLQYRFQRGAPLHDAAAVDNELAQPTEQDTVVSTFVDLMDELPAGGSTPFQASVPIGSTAPVGLDVRRPAVYPLMLNVNGDLPEPAGTTRARVGEVHLLLTVLSPPPLPAPADGSGEAPATPPAVAPAPTARPVPVALFWPFTDRPHLGVGGVFLDDELAAEVRPGGRLDTLLTQLSKMPYPQAVTLVVDPMLLDELDRMTRGYRVTATPGTPQPALTPPSGADLIPATTGASRPSSPAPSRSPVSRSSATASAAPGTGGAGSGSVAVPVRSTGSTAAGSSRSSSPTTVTTGIPPAAEQAGTVAGTGAAEASAFLTALSEQAARHRVVSLPYSDADAVALVRAGMDVDLRNAARRGREVAGRVLDTANLITSVAVPPGGVLDDATAAVLTQAGYTSLVLRGSTVQSQNAAPVGALDLQLPDSAGGGTVPALVGDSPLLPLIGELAAGARGSSSASRVNTLAAQLAQRSFDGDTAPVAYLPADGATPSTAGYLRLTSLLAVLASGGAVVGGDPAGLATAATEHGTLEYPSSQADELPSGYLDRWKDIDSEVTAVRAAVAPAAVAGSPDPSDLTDQLTEATAPLGSAAMRSDQRPGDLVLSTIESSVVGVRSQVSIRETAGSYTLASGSSPLVLTVKNDLPYDVSLRVMITGGARNGLTASDPGLIRISAKRTKQVPIPTTVARSGTFQIGARLIGPDGRTWGTPVVLRITSTAYGALTVILVSVAGGVLLLMVIFRIAQRWRHRRRGPDDPPDGPAPDSITAAANDATEGSLPRE